MGGTSVLRRLIFPPEDNCNGIFHKNFLKRYLKKKEYKDLIQLTICLLCNVPEQLASYVREPF